MDNLGPRRTGILRSAQRTESLMAEIERMRETLQAIAYGYLGDQTAENQFIWAQRVAREALKRVSDND